MEPAGSVLQLLVQLWVIGFTGQTFEAAGRLFGVFGELPLILVAGTARRATLLGGGPALPLCLLLLPPGELLQRLHRFVELVAGLSTLTTLDGLVLVLELIELELEDVGQVVRSGSSSSSSSSLLPLTDLDLIALLGLLETLERFELRWHRLL